MSWGRRARIVGLLWLTASTALAQISDPGDLPGAESSHVSAEMSGPTSALLSEDELAELLRSAVAAYDASDLELAQTLFERIHAQTPSARTLRGLALVAYRKRDYARAVELFEASLQHPVKPLTEQLREDALDLLGRARAELAAAPAAPAATAIEASTAPVSPGPSAAASQGGVRLPMRAGTPTGPRIERSAASPAPEVDHRERVRARRLKRSAAVLAATGLGSLFTSGVVYAIGRVRLKRISDICASEPGGYCYDSEVQVREHAARLDLLSHLSMAFAVIGSLTTASALPPLALYYRSHTFHDRQRSEIGLTLTRAF